MGTLIASDIYEGLRPAAIDDVGGILELIRPLEEDGTLVMPARAVEMEIERFVLLERDGAIIGCAALYPVPEEGVGELACVAVHPSYRNSGRADILLVPYRTPRPRATPATAVRADHSRAAHWFRERGFEPAEVANLPVQNKPSTNWQRRPKSSSKPCKLLGVVIPEDASMPIAAARYESCKSPTLHLKTQPGSHLGRGWTLG